MQTTSLTPSQQIVRRLIVAASVIASMGVAGMAIGRETTARAEVRPAPVVNVATITATPVAAPDVEGLLHDEVVETEQALAAARIEPQVVAPKTRTVEMEVTAYCACTKCCGPKAQGITASGRHVSHNGGVFVAADRMYKFGTKLIVPGYGNSQPVEVLDRGGAIKGNKLDVYFASHQEALKWGRQKLAVTIVE